MWQVRKACVEILPQISELTDETTQNSQIVQIFSQLSGDGSRWVKLEIFKQIGKLILSFKTNDKNSDVIDFFLKMGNPASKEVALASIDNETAF